MNMKYFNTDSSNFQEKLSLQVNVQLLLAVRLCVSSYSSRSLASVIAVLLSGNGRYNVTLRSGASYTWNVICSIIISPAFRWSNALVPIGVPMMSWRGHHCWNSLLSSINSWTSYRIALFPIHGGKITKYRTCSTVPSQHIPFMIGCVCRTIRPMI